jgi:pyridoxine kinase
MAPRLLSDTTITDLDSLAAAVQILHKTYQVPHIIITSLKLTRSNQTLSSRAPSKQASQHGSGSASPALDAETSHPSAWPTEKSASSQQQEPDVSLDEVENLTIIGSTATSDHKPRLFRIDTPLLPVFFSGTGDMFAALTIPRLIEAVHNASTPDLKTRPSWRSPDDVPPEELPLAKAVQKVLASMQSILGKTTEKCKEVMEAYDKRAEKEGCGSGDEDNEDREKRRHLALMNASEVKVVRFVKDIVDPPNLERFKPKAVEEGSKVPEDVGKREPGEFGVLRLGIGDAETGALQVVTGEE